MSLLGFERETLLDLTVNLIPLGIIAVFIVAFAVSPAWGVDPVFSTMQYAIVVTMFLGLAVLSYFVARAVEDAETPEDAAH